MPEDGKRFVKTRDQGKVEKGLRGRSKKPLLFILQAGTYVDRTPPLL